MANSSDDTMRWFREEMADQRRQLHRMAVNNMVDMVIMKFVAADKADAARLHLRDKFQEMYEMGKKEASS